jgi:hypothetical protein
MWRYWYACYLHTNEIYSSHQARVRTVQMICEGLTKKAMQQYIYISRTFLQPTLCCPLHAVMCCFLLLIFLDSKLRDLPRRSFVRSSYSNPSLQYNIYTLTFRLCPRVSHKANLVFMSFFP